MVRKRKLALTREGWYYLLVLVFVFGGAISREINVLMLLAGLLAGPLVLSAVLAVITLKRMQVSRKLPEGICAGDRLIVEVSATNVRTRLPAWAVVVEDRLEPLGSEVKGRTTVGVFFPQVRPGETCQVAYQGRVFRRGQYRLGPLRLSTAYPLGLVRRTLLLDQPELLTVFPRLGSLTPDWAQFRRADDAVSEHSARRQGLIEAEFHGLRDWRPGDSRRWIHWRSSARRGALVVRQFEQRHDQDLVLLVDLWSPAEPGLADCARVESAVSFAASVLTAACRHGGNHVTIGVASPEAIDQRGNVSNIFLREMMHLLALVLPHHEEGVPAALARTLADSPAGARAVLISTRKLTAEAVQLVAGPRRSRRPLDCIEVGSPEWLRYFEPEK